ncbi:MAG: FHA domain-containing protein [Anaerolineales bacterium]
MDSASGKFCPVCKHKNEPDATVCTYCGSPLEFSQEGPSTTRRVNRKGEETNVLPQMAEEAIQKAFKPPKEGIAIYVKEYAAPIAIRKEAEFTLGRLLTGNAEEAFVDLKPFGGYENGVSRRHALIRRTDHGYDILDLGSTNGTWLNKKRLIAEKPYPLESGAQVRLGRLQIFVIYPEIAAKP